MPRKRRSGGLDWSAEAMLNRSMRFDKEAQTIFKGPEKAPKSPSSRLAADLQSQYKDLPQGARERLKRREEVRNKFK